MNVTTINAFDIPDAWYQALHAIIKNPVREYIIDRGSFEGSKRREFDFITIKIEKPWLRPLFPIMPETSSIPVPTSEKYINEYAEEYLLSDDKTDREGYTYGERLINPKVKINTLEFPLKINPIEELIKMLNKSKNTNQATLEIAMPSDIMLPDPPCCRLLDFRISDNKLHMYIYFRSNDLWGGFPTNLAGLQLLKEYIVNSLNGVEDGEIIYMSKGLHLYDYCWNYAEELTRNKRFELEIPIEVKTNPTPSSANI